MTSMGDKRPNAISERESEHETHQERDCERNIHAMIS
jgi:hypothetical protein